MRHSPRPRLRASHIKASRIDLTPGARWAISCPDCGSWWSLKRSAVTPHRADPDAPGLCPGSGRRVHVDLTPAEWIRQVHEAIGDAARYKPPRESTQVSKPPAGVRLEDI